MLKRIKNLIRELLYSKEILDNEKELIKQQEEFKKLKDQRCKDCEFLESERLLYERYKNTSDKYLHFNDVGYFDFLNQSGLCSNCKRIVLSFEEFKFQKDKDTKEYWSDHVKTNQKLVKP